MDYKLQEKSATFDFTVKKDDDYTNLGLNLKEVVNRKSSSSLGTFTQLKECKISNTRKSTECYKDYSSHHDKTPLFGVVKPIDNSKENASMELSPKVREELKLKNRLAAKKHRAKKALYYKQLEDDFSNMKNLVERLLKKSKLTYLENTDNINAVKITKTLPFIEDYIKLDSNYSGLNDSSQLGLVLSMNKENFCDVQNLMNLVTEDREEKLKAMSDIIDKASVLNESTFNFFDEDAEISFPTPFTKLKSILKTESKSKENFKENIKFKEDNIKEKMILKFSTTSPTYSTSINSKREYQKSPMTEKSPVKDFFRFEKSDKNDFLSKKTENKSSILGLLESKIHKQKKIQMVKDYKEEYLTFNEVKQEVTNELKANLEADLQGKGQEKIPLVALAEAHNQTQMKSYSLHSLNEVSSRNSTDNTIEAGMEMDLSKNQNHFYVSSKDFLNPSYCQQEYTTDLEWTDFRNSNLCKTETEEKVFLGNINDFFTLNSEAYSDYLNGVDAENIFSDNEKFKNQLTLGCYDYSFSLNKS